MKSWKLIWLVGAGLLTACASSGSEQKNPGGLDYTPVRGTALVDNVTFYQKDPKWAAHNLGSTSETIETDGCLLTATAMVLGNLGFETDPGDLNKRMTAVNGFTKNGWLVWSAIDKVTNGTATARYYDSVSLEIIDGCIADGYYPLARFILPNGRSHWAMILRRSEQGFHMRDPLHKSNQPLIFPRGVDAFKAIRCVGIA
ncbi:MAG: hypothetical protein HKN36_09060 [Hellea sp.]|nr:hypothetical protein [Hellea sp.]